MESEFEKLNKKRKKVFDLNQVIIYLNKKIYDICVDMDSLDKECSIIIRNIDELNCYEKEKEVKEKVITLSFSFAFLALLVVLMVNVPGFNIIGKLIVLLSASIVSLLSCFIGVKINHKYFLNKRTKNYSMIEAFNMELSKTKNLMLEKEKELISLKSLEEVFIEDMKRAQEDYNTMYESIKEKCIPLIDNLISKELESKPLDNEDDLILARKFINNKFD